MNAYKHREAFLARPQLAEFQVRLRLGLARQRTRTYPLDSMDFIMMDLERPDLCHRHAHWCTGDLTGRLLEFLAYADGMDGQHDPGCRNCLSASFVSAGLRVDMPERPSARTLRYATA